MDQPAAEPEPIYFAGPTLEGELLGWDSTSIFRLPYSELEEGENFDEEEEQEPAPVMTQAQYDKCMAFLESVETAKGSIGNQALQGIVQEELSAYYAGQRSLEETCAIIQSRAQTYVSEQLG